MSKTVIAYLSTLFGKEERSDASIVFCIPRMSEDENRKKAKTEDVAAGFPGQVGSPLPVHLILIATGSAMLGAQAERWTSDSTQGKPVLKVSLNSEEEHPHALAAVNFIYTGTLMSKTAAGLLQLRRQAAYLQVEGCMDACDAAVLALLTTSTPSPLACVLELYGSRHMLPRAGDDPATYSLLDGVYRACRKQLVAHSGGIAGDVLAWVFRDAPSILSSCDAQAQLVKLPMAAIEALLGSETFATDNESSVLLLLSTWLVANPATRAAEQTRLCKLVRLAQLSEPYLTSIMPQLVVGSGWFPITREELCCVTMWASADAAKRARLETASSGQYDTAGAWYSTAPRPKAPSDAGRPHTFSVMASELATHGAAAAVVKTHTRVASVAGIFGSTGTERVVASGFEWGVYIQFKADVEEPAGVFLWCYVPLALGLPDPKKLSWCVASPAPCELVVHRWRADGVKEVAHSRKFGSADHIPFGRGLGITAALPLAKEAGLAAWSAYLHDGKVSGWLTWDER